MSQVHDHIFKLLCIECEEKDKAIVTKLTQLASFKTTPDQLGVPEDYAIQLPAAVRIFRLKFLIKNNKKSGRHRTFFIIIILYIM